MARRSTGQLPKPKRKHRPSRHQTAFETEQAAREEDELRRRSMMGETAIRSGRIDEAARLDCVALLQHNLRSSTARMSLASAISVRDMRGRLGGAMWALVERHPNAGWHMVTILSGDWIVTPEQLQSMELVRLVRSLRQDLRRAGVAETGGALIAVLEGEYEDETGMWVLHFHGLASGNMVKAVSKLKLRRKYQPVRKSAKRPAIKRPILIQKINPAAMPTQFSYCLKFWRARRSGPVGSAGEEKRSHKGHRVPEPYHSEALVFLHKHRLEDITLLIGVRVNRKGFKRSPKKTPA